MQRLPQNMWLEQSQTWSNNLWCTFTDTSGGMSFLYQFQAHSLLGTKESEIGMCLYINALTPL